MTFSSPSWRSLNPLKGSLNHPKKVTLNHQANSKRFFHPPWHSEPSPCGSHNPIIRSMALTNVSAASRHQSSRSLPQTNKKRGKGRWGVKKTQRKLTFLNPKNGFLFESLESLFLHFPSRGPFLKVKQPLVFGLDGLGFSPKVMKPYFQP